MKQKILPARRDRRLQWMFIAGLVGIAGIGQSAETPQFIREKVLPRAGSAKKLRAEFPLAPLSKAAGVVFHQPYTLSDATEYRVHLKVIGDVPPGNITEIRLGPYSGSRAWSWTPTSGRQEIWSGVVPNNSIIEVRSTSPNNPIRIVIDQTVSVVKPPKKLAITPPDDRASIIGQPIEFVAWGKAVGRIRFMADDGGEYLCTGFLIATDLIMTNHHCMKTQSEAASAQVDFDYDGTASHPLTISVKELLLADADLDFAVHRLERSASRAALKLADGAIYEDEALLIIQHPAGEPKQISQKDCKVSGASMRGVSSGLTDFGHLCDTLGGSSGSPVIDLSSKTVVGLHHLGFLPMSEKLVNQAVKMGPILKLIRERHPGLLPD